jgi:hypothetical protein
MPQNQNTVWQLYSPHICYYFLGVFNHILRFLCGSHLCYVHVSSLSSTMQESSLACAPIHLCRTLLSKRRSIEGPCMRTMDCDFKSNLLSFPGLPEAKWYQIPLKAVEPLPIILKVTVLQFAQ